MIIRNRASMQRAYSRFEVKRLNAAQRIISGIATTPTPDRMADVVEPLGAKFDLPLPFLWQHDAVQPVGTVTHAAPTRAGISVDVQLAQIDEPGVLQDRLDEAWQSIEIGLVRGLSIGFAPIEYSIIEETGGLRFTKWAWLELSAVTVPANAEASISAIKRYDASASKRRSIVLLGRRSTSSVKLIGLRSSSDARKGGGIRLSGSTVKLTRPAIKLKR
jgi:HK97 family phage prohead protease